ncbi:MAG: protein translocase subunit SecDF, partial [Muribaculaceae bacterium]|nr:protein translocase subunit SecDF [Muribaculaceae bacterium]
MQSKGKLGSIVAGVIAIFLVLVCLFYLSFTWISNKYENQAESYAKTESLNADDEAYNQAYKHYMDSLGEKKVYMGYYTLNEVRKWGVGLGLDLKGGMNVILQVDMPDMLRSMKAGNTDSVFESALAKANAAVASHQSDDFVASFIKNYREAKPQADFSVVF